MARNWTHEELAEVQKRLVSRYPVSVGAASSPGKTREPLPQPAQAGGSPAPNKYGAIRTTAPASWGGERLADSKAGAALARTMDAMKRAGSILDWWEEVSLPIGVDERGKVIRYRADAVALMGYTECGCMAIRVFDAKRGSMDTPTSKAKRAALRCRGLNVEVVDGKVGGVG